MNKSCLIIPCYNEEHRIDEKKYDEFISKDLCDFVFVDDGSRDRTGEIIKSICVQYNNADQVVLETNQGKAGATREGIKFVLSKKGNYNYIGFWDSDLSTPLETFLEFLNLADETDACCIIASRVRRLGSSIRRKWYRHYLGRIFATIVSFMLKCHVYDTQCGAKIFKADIAKEVFREKFISKWFFDVEILYRLKSLNHAEKIYEAPLKEWEDVNGSKLRLLDFLATPKELFKIWLHYRK